MAMGQMLRIGVCVAYLKSRGENPWEPSEAGGAQGEK